MSDNMPTLYENIMYSLPSDFARDVFLWATDKFKDDRMCYRAEKFAIEADRVTRTFRGLIGLRQSTTLRNGGRLLNEDQEADFMRFMQARLANYRVGGNVKTAMPELTA